jgi:prepilin-type N-terminal cleavage/methylation domain-containing protein
MKKKFKAFSLVEMLITLGIMSIVLLIATQTLNTTFRVSTIVQLKTTTRNEINFATDLMEKLLANSNVADVYIYQDTNEIRAYNSTDETMFSDQSSEQLALEYEDREGDLGNEIHIRPYGYSLWVCIGYFNEYNGEIDTSSGYLLKRTLPNLNSGHHSCFDTTSISTEDYPILVLNSEDVTVNDFKISYIKSSDLNNVFYVDFEMEPVHWVPGDRSEMERAVFRQAIVTTQGLTWY